MYVFNVASGFLNNAYPDTPFAASPVVYLKPTIKITGGNGQIGETNSYKLG